MKSSAHLKTLREACGLSQREAVAYIGKGSLRTWKYWESTDTEAPTKEDVLEKLENLLDWQEEQVAKIVDVAEEVGEAFHLTRYRNQELLDMHHPEYPGGLGSHTNVVLSIFRELSALGHDVTIVWDGDGLSGTDWK